nr:hypothetical protein [Tanacetum cinerariifolium]
MSIQRYRAQQAKPMTRGDTVKFIRTYIKNMSAAYYSSGPSLGSTPADEVPADIGVSTAENVPADQRVFTDQSVLANTRIPAGTCISAEAATTTIPVNAPLDEDEPAEKSSSLRRSTRKKSIAQKRTTPLSLSIPFSTDDPDVAHTVDITFASDDSDEDDTLHPIITVDREYPLEIGVMEQLLDHKLQIEKDPVGNTITTDVQLIQRIKGYLKEANRPNGFSLPCQDLLIGLV